MGLLLSILFSYVGAVEFMFVVRDIVHQIGLHHEKMKFYRDKLKVTSSLHELQDDLRKSIKEARMQLYETDDIHTMADGIQYNKSGYRILSANEENLEKRWLESRAIASIEPTHIVEANDVVKSIVNENQCKNDPTPFTVLQRKSSNAEINDRADNQVAIDMNHLNGSSSGNKDDCEMPEIHFDEYSQDKSYNYESITKMSLHQQHKHAEPGRRKSFKVFSSTGTHTTADEFQRRRSNDIDGETDNPWGELKPENFHDANLWSRERAMSIAEKNEESIGTVDEKLYETNFKQDVKALNRAPTAIPTMMMMTKTDNGMPALPKENGKTFGEPDETYESDVSSEIPSSLPHCFDEVNPACNSKAGQIRNVPEILVDGLDLDEIVEDYTIDDNDIELDKHQFKEYLEKPTRLRHSSYNYEIDEDNEGELNEFSIVRRNEEGDEAADFANENKSIDTNNARQGQKGRKPNMFASSFGGGNGGGDSNSTNNNSNSSSIGHERDNQCEYRPLVRITSTEDERVEHFLQEENINKTHRNGGDSLIKSKTTQMFEFHDESVCDDADSFESRANSPSSVTSPIYVTRRESMVSDVGSEPIQFECKRPQSSNYCYNREDSSSSNKSNLLFERSQSHLSDLEYIKGRDDWKDDYILSNDIREEIDSDNYHHLRRHSEAADTLEYIRGREDWLLRNEVRRNHRTSLAQIFEAGEPKIFIQDEIDSDEYHHNFFQHETFHAISKSDAQTDESPGFSKHSIKVENNFDEQFVADGVGERSCNEITVTASNLNSVHEPPVAIPNTNIVFDKSNDIDVVIEDLIKHDPINNDDIEITVWDLTPDSHKNNPFIFISEATSNNQDIQNERNSNQSIGLLHPDSVEASNSNACTSIYSNDTNINIISECGDLNQNGSINKFLNAEIQSENKNRLQSIAIDEIEREIKIDSNKEQKQESNRNLRSKSERLDLLTTGCSRSGTKQKPRRTLSFENVDDLLFDWFHK